MYISKLPSTCQKVDLLEHFSTFGDVFSAKIVKNKKNTCKGYGKVTFNSEIGFKQVLKHQHVIHGQLIEVEPFLNDKDLIQREIKSSGYKIKVSNLDKSTKLHKLKKLFKKYGQVISIHIEKDSTTKLNICVVEFNDKKITEELILLRKLPVGKSQENSLNFDQYDASSNQSTEYLIIEPYEFVPNQNQFQKIMKLKLKEQRMIETNQNYSYRQQLKTLNGEQTFNSTINQLGLDNINLNSRNINTQEGEQAQKHQNRYSRQQLENIAKDEHNQDFFNDFKNFTPPQSPNNYESNQQSQFHQRQTNHENRQEMENNLKRGERNASVFKSGQNYHHVSDNQSKNMAMIQYEDQNLEQEEYSKYLLLKYRQRRQQTRTKASRNQGSYSNFSSLQNTRSHPNLPVFTASIKNKNRHSHIHVYKFGEEEQVSTHVGSYHQYQALNQRNRNQNRLVECNKKELASNDNGIDHSNYHKHFKNQSRAMETAHIDEDSKESNDSQFSNTSGGDNFNFSPRRLRNNQRRSKSAMIKITIEKVPISKKTVLEILMETYNLKLNIKKYRDPNLRFNRLQPQD